jgi:hypothetical protein
MTAKCNPPVFHASGFPCPFLRTAILLIFCNFCCLPRTYGEVSKIFRTGVAIYTAVVVARSTGPNRPNCEFRVRLQSFAANAWKRVKTSPRTLARTDLVASPWQHSNEIEAERMPVWYHWGDPGRISECLTLWRKRTSRERSKNAGYGGTGVYMLEGTTSRAMAADKPVGEFYSFHSVSLEYFG